MPAQSFNPGSASLAPLMAQGSQIQNEDNIAQQQMTLRDMLSQQQLRQAQTANVNVETQQRQRDLQDAMTIQKTLPGILDQNGGKFDPDQVRTGLTKAGVNLKTVEDVIGSHVGNDQKVAETGRLNAAAKEAQANADNLTRQRDQHVREHGGAAADAIAAANYSVPVAESILSTYEANDPEYKKSGQGDKLRQLAATDPVAFKQQIDTLRNNPDYLSAKASREKTVAETKEATSRAEYTSEQAAAAKAARASAEQFASGPNSILGPGGTIDGLDLPADQKTALKKQVATIWALPGLPQKKLEEMNAAIQKTIDAETELRRQTDPRLLEFDKKRAGATATATAEAQAAAFGIGAGADQASQTARDVADYRVPFAQAVARLPGAARDRLLAQIKTLNPDFQAAQYDIAKDTEKAFTSGKPAGQANALNTMMGHLDILDQASAALKNGNVQVLNRLANSIGAQTGSTARTTYDTIVHRVGPEVTTAYLAAGGSVGERGTNEQDFSSSLSPDQIRSNIAISAKLADSKIKALQDQYNRGTYSRGKQKLITDEAEGTRRRLAGGAASGNSVTYQGNIYTFTDPAKMAKFKQDMGIQ